MTPSETMTPHPEEKKKGLNGIKRSTMNGHNALVSKWLN